MQLKDQVVSLELARKLKKLDVKQESLFVWVNWQDKKFGDNWQLEYLGNGKVLKHIFETNEYYPAFTVAELREMLPSRIEPCIMRCMKTLKGEYICQYRANDEEGGKELYCTQEKTEANARAKLLIYLLENNLMELPR